MSFKKLVARIEAENEIFNGLTKAEKRVKIAEDCLDRIRVKSFQPVTGTLLSSETRNFIRLKDDVKTTVNTSIQCVACAKGGLFLSYVGRVNNFQSCKVSGGNSIKDEEHIKLLEIFTARQLSLIELAFEGEQHLMIDERNNYIAHGNKSMKARAIYSEHVQPTSRMIAICNNIIENKGTFKP